MIVVEKENRRIILICGEGRRINLSELLMMEDFFEKKEKENEEQFLKMAKEVKIEDIEVALKKETKIKIKH